MIACVCNNSFLGGIDTTTWILLQRPLLFKNLPQGIVSYQPEVQLIVVELIFHNTKLNAVLESFDKIQK